MPTTIADSTADAAGTYTIKPGDSLYTVARRHRVTLGRLQQANGITDPTKLKPGMVLKIPAAPAKESRLATLTRPAPMPSPMAPARASDVPPMRFSAPVAPTPHATPGPTSLTAPSGAPRLTVLNTPDASPPPAPPPRVAALGNDTVVPPIEMVPPTEPDTLTVKPPATALSPAPITPAESSAAIVPAIKFRGPAKGRVICRFGANADSTQSDGIKISVPMGADVVAAEGGVVAYAGSELKGYGNLILIRHANNWVTAYAHNEELLVKRGDAVRRGQTIAKAGKTGNVDQPQLHFELRQGAKPVDPLPYLEAL
jgi:murein DD-endopeptidase MepM/ murein hydrolase activator NlpD